MKFTIHDFNERFTNEDACLDELFRMRYAGMSECPKCGKPAKYSRVNNRKCYQCNWCGNQVYPMTGTPFEKSSTSLKSWFFAIYLMTSTRHGVPAKEIERQLGVTYKTAWRMCHEIRKLMADVNNEPLKGHVEVDESYFGGKAENMHKHVRERRIQGRGAVGKTAVFGMVERGDETCTSIVKAKVVGDTLMSTLTGEILQHVQPGAFISSDESLSYNSLYINGFKHLKVQHSAREYVQGICHVNNIEGFWSRLKVSVSGTHVWVSSKHLQRYVDEFAFRYNHRGATPGKMFNALFGRLRRD